jgi:hypothetical protein
MGWICSVPGSRIASRESAKATVELQPSEKLWPLSNEAGANRHLIDPRTLAYCTFTGNFAGKRVN